MDQTTREPVTQVPDDTFELSGPSSAPREPDGHTRVNLPREQIAEATSSQSAEYEQTCDKAIQIIARLLARHLVRDPQDMPHQLANLGAV
ncbi:hypothetical protein DRW48_04030 [Paracoccus suum]|uniref:Uncharacterized protein n=1 Tax=Paracoccus suum TaxID=2259340 RepID=A0A344PHX0_9RHOB|nr:hypothetical protein [Paracoccus suum]AXC48975.1 hypothetical protein DRW48_04030 [Paracoccus suum]